ncbi:MAG: biotin--[acetyl-CoA-carboxylase] ligase [Verrucomicrobia bacterium]|nr:biotin--[acetyl-CoA-carboxylase] ligase [Verrucomicrobiota bacterium]|tara:strand:- start:4643 stop:5428 length:786 start_codon:yes stop_codon:yes gene_type:complete
MPPNCNKNKRLNNNAIVNFPSTYRSIKLEHTPSTNSYASNYILKHNFDQAHVFHTNVQTEGRARNGKSWISEPHKNLLFSLVVNFEFPLEKRFYISKAVALGLKDYLDSLSVQEVKIKWPNDILVRNEKIAGILIENSIAGDQIQTAIIGVGLNVNQFSFPEFERKATSLFKVTELILDFEEVLDDVVQSILHRLNQLSEVDTIDHDYHNALYGKGKRMNFDHKGENFSATIEKVDVDGLLWLRSPSGTLAYDLNSLVFKD